MSMKINDIVIEFSSSVWKESEAERAHALGFEVGDLKQYQVVSGSTFNEQYNETLDNAAIVLSHVIKEDRLSSIKPYDYVRVFDKSDNTGFDKLYLIDSYDEKETNLVDHVFGYTINLMSETKLLEKVQCPNLAITHKVNEDGSISKKSIYQYIKQYMELYVPKMKFSDGDGTWSYKPVIQIQATRHAIMSIPFGMDDFTNVGANWVLNVESSAIDNTYDPDTVKILGLEIENGPGFNSTESASFSTVTKTFTVTGTGNHPETGTAYVSYSYSLLETEEELYKRFNVPCADMGSGNFTLRQLITMLMQQVGCIPVVKNRALSFLDFQKDAQDFGIDGDYTLNNTVNYIRRSLSSDSYVNTLVNMSSNVLDSENEVICEALGFRDRSSLLLRQKQNLYLETKFPIYKVNEFKINAYVNSDIDIRALNNPLSNVGPSTGYTASWNIDLSKNGSILSLDANLSFGSNQVNTSFNINGTVTAFYNNSSEVLAKETFSVDKTINGSSFVPNVDDVIDFTLLNANCDKFYFYGLIEVKNTSTQQKTTYRVFAYNSALNFSHLLCLYTQDITKLLLENSVRQTLSSNFEDMIDETSSSAVPTPTLDTLAKYVYGTIGFSIGSKQISGFSNVFNIGSATILGWLNKDYTYIENLWIFITTFYRDSIEDKIVEMLGDIPIAKNDYIDVNGNLIPGTITNLSITNIIPYNPYYDYDPSLTDIFSNHTNFVYLWFDIKYQPLNSFNLAYVKSIEDVDYTLAQYDSNASGLTDFDRLSIHEQEQVDRVGNETLSISQRTEDYDDILTFDNGPLIFQDDTNRSGSVEDTDSGIKYVIFKRTFTINNNFFNANYVGSKDAVLKDYFTSIRTKYRAYQYVDYSQATLRKERDTFYVRISENDWYDGDDRVFFGAFTNLNQNNQQYLMGRLLGNWIPGVSDNSSALAAKYSVLSSDNTQTKNDISIVTNDKFFAIIYEEADNVGSGTYITDTAVAQTKEYRTTALGGVPQAWQIWENDYYYSHYVSYVCDLNIGNIFNNYIDTGDISLADIKEDFDKILSFPILDNDFVDLDSSNNVVLSIVENNKDINARKRVFYKDLAEVINHTVQFIYYTDSKNIIWNENFFKLNNVSGLFEFDSIDLVNLEGQDFVLNNEPYQGLINIVPETYTDILSLHNGSSEHTNPFIQIEWGTIVDYIRQFKVVASKTIGSITYRYDVLGFKFEKDYEQRFYFTLNDTKTDYVMGEQHGVLYRKYKVKTNTTDRDTVDNPDIYDGGE